MLKGTIEHLLDGVHSHRLRCLANGNSPSRAREDFLLAEMSFDEGMSPDLALPAPTASRAQATWKQKLAIGAFMTLDQICKVH